MRLDTFIHMRATDKPLAYIAAGSGVVNVRLDSVGDAHIIFQPDALDALDRLIDQLLIVQAGARIQAGK